MWLINIQTRCLEYFTDEREAQKLQYAILSHTWGSHEVEFAEFNERYHGTEWANNAQDDGLQKIAGVCQRARDDGYTHVWIDTCCINRSNSAELSEAINSMYRYYQNAAMCYVYLKDLELASLRFDASGRVTDLRLDELQPLKWFSRGWTLQELIAPQHVKFFDSNWRCVGSKTHLAIILSKFTKIDQSILHDSSLLSSMSIATRFSWAAGRQTTRIEDEAYSLLGIFDINMPMLYGEGKKAFRRLQEEIIRQSTDHSIFAWLPSPSSKLHIRGSLFAPDATAFQDAGSISSPFINLGAPFELTNAGLRVNLPVCEQDGCLLAKLNCSDMDSDQSVLLVLKKIGSSIPGRISCEIVRGDDQLLTAEEEILTWTFKDTDLMILRNPMLSSFRVNLELDRSCEIISAHPKLSPYRDHDLTASLTAQSRQFETGRASLKIGNGNPLRRPHRIMLKYGQYLCHEDCEGSFRMEFVQSDKTREKLFRLLRPSRSNHDYNPDAQSNHEPVYVSLSDESQAPNTEDRLWAKADLSPSCWVVDRSNTSTLLQTQPTIVKPRSISIIDPIWTIKLYTESAFTPQNEGKLKVTVTDARGKTAVLQTT